MKKNLIFKLCFIVGIFLIILTACDLGTKQWANITFSLEGPAIEQARANSGASSSARYIHPYASSLKFELFSGKELLDSQTISIQSGTKSISITVKGVPLNDPNLRAEIEVWGTMTGGPLSILGQNSIHLGRIGLGYTKLSLGVKPVGNYLGTATYEEDGDDIYIELNIPNPDNPFFVCWEIKMLSQKGLYTIEAYENDLVLYASDGRQYKNTHSIKGQDGYYTLVFYHPKDEPSTYYLASSDNEFYISYGTKLEQDILITQYDKEMDSDNILTANPGEVDFDTVDFNTEVTPKTLSFTIYNPYSQALSFTKTISNSESKEENVPDDSWKKFTAPGFPTFLPPGGRRDFDIIFTPTYNDKVFADFTIQAAGLDDFVLELSGSESGF